MDGGFNNDGGGPQAAPFNFKLVPAFERETLLEQVRSALARDLPEVRTCAPNDITLSVAGGGPSLADTYKELGPYKAAVNGSLAWLLDKGVVPDLCGVCDPSPHMADIVEAHKDVTYFIASCVHPSVFDKLINAGCYVVRWHVIPMDGIEQLLDASYSKRDWLGIGGGSTMGMRWINLGYQCGFRKFHMHGLDSSFRIDPERGRASHAYPDHQDNKDWVTFDGFQTKPNFIGQVADFMLLMNRYTQPDIDPVEIRMFGEGLLQKRFREWQAENPGWHAGGPKPKLLTDGFRWPAHDKFAAPAILSDVADMKEFAERIPRRGVAVQAGGNVGVYPVHLAQWFSEVHTFEPDPENFACLAENIKLNKGNIRAYHAALGAEDGTVRLEAHEPRNSGAIMVREGGDVPMRAIDDLGLSECDLIWLDVEGYEEEALKGAASTIARCHPAVIIEENLLPEKHGLRIGGARLWLEARGYKRDHKVANDTMFVWTGA